MSSDSLCTGFRLPGSETTTTTTCDRPRDIELYLRNTTKARPSASKLKLRTSTFVPVVSTRWQREVYKSNGRNSSSSNLCTAHCSDSSRRRTSHISAYHIIMADPCTVIHPSIKLIHHLMLACWLVLMSFSPLKNGIPRSLKTTTTWISVTAVTLALEGAYATSVGDLQRSTVASVAGRQYDLRLVGSNVTNEGLLQVFMDNKWGWVYAYPEAFNSMVAKVACQQMGYLEYSTEVNFSLDVWNLHPIHWLMARVKCSGYESRLVDCGHINYTSTLLAGEQSIKVALKCMGVAASGNDSVQVLLNGTSSSGFLQIKKAPYRGWLPFCGYNTDIGAAHVICRQLGHTHALSIMHVLNPLAISRASPPVVRSMSCQGWERSLSECSVSVRIPTPQCQKMRVNIHISCSDVPLYPLGSEVRLDALNRVKVRYNGFWNYLTSDIPVTSDAVAVCQQYGGLNLSRAWIKEESALDPVLPFRFLCSRGNEASLMECIPVKIPAGSSHSSILHVECSGEATPAFGSLRLVSNQSPNKGRIEIYGNQSQWGTICDDYWTDEAATVACRQLGLGNIGISRGNAYYGSGDGPIFLDDVQCDGHEETLLQCESSPLGDHNCVHSEDAGVECYAQMPTVAPNKEWKVSLVNGPGPYSGTIQLQINDQIGTICDDHFGINDGLVVCHMLGYPFIVNVHANAHFGIGRGDILLDDLQCTGTESSLEDCWFAPLGTHNCMHHEDAGVTCSHDYDYGPARWTETPLVSIPTSGGLSPNGLNMGIGSATILITLLVVMCVGCMFCACIMRRLRVNSNIETINNNRDNNYALVNQRETTPGSANSVPPSYTDVLTNPNEYSQVNHTSDGALPPQSPPPNSPPPSYARTFQIGNNTLRVITITDPSSEGEQTVRREPIPIPLSPPPSYDDAAPVFPSPNENRSGQALPDVVTVSAEVDERSALREIPEVTPGETPGESENTTVI